MAHIIRLRRRIARRPAAPLGLTDNVSEASAANVIPLTRPCRANASTPSQLRDGMCPRFFQDDTTDGLIPNLSATELVPPSGSMMSATVHKRAMKPTIVRSRRTRQQLATLEPELATLEPRRRRKYAEMADEMSDGLKNLARRLVQTREALELTQVELCRQIGVPKNIYNPFEKGRRRITIDIAIKIRRRFKIGLNWIYCGDLTDLPHDLSLKLGSPPKQSREVS